MQLSVRFYVGVTSLQWRSYLDVCFDADWHFLVEPILGMGEDDGKSVGYGCKIWSY